MKTVLSSIVQLCGPSIRLPEKCEDGSTASAAYPSNITLDLSGGAMSTASGLVFTGDNDGYLYAFDSANGKELWRFQTGAAIWGAPPITYMLDGRAVGGRSDRRDRDRLRIAGRNASVTRAGRRSSRRHEEHE